MTHIVSSRIIATGGKSAYDKQHKDLGNGHGKTICLNFSTLTLMLQRFCKTSGFANIIIQFYLIYKRHKKNIHSYVNKIHLKVQFLYIFILENCQFRQIISALPVSLEYKNEATSMQNPPVNNLLRRKTQMVIDHHKTSNEYKQYILLLGLTQKEQENITTIPTNSLEGWHENRPDCAQ